MVALKEFATGAMAVCEGRGRDAKRRRRSAERQEEQIMVAIGLDSGLLGVIGSLNRREME